MLFPKIPVLKMQIVLKTAVYSCPPCILVAFKYSAKIIKEENKKQVLFNI